MHGRAAACLSMQGDVPLFEGWPTFRGSRTMAFGPRPSGSAGTYALLSCLAAGAPSVSNRVDPHGIGVHPEQHPKVLGSVRWMAAARDSGDRGNERFLTQDKLVVRE